MTERNRWLKLEVIARPEDEELLSSLLLETGTLGTEEQFLQDKGRRDRPIAMAAYYPVQLKAQRRLEIEELLTKAGFDNYRWSELSDEGWADNWRQFFSPIKIGSISILPPWERESSGPNSIFINPGMAFGTGHHPTTKGSLLALQKYLPRDEILDLGTGSGILAIAAVKLGAKKVLGIDIDPQSIDAAEENRELNRIPADRVEFRLLPLEQIEQRFDLIVANIQLNVLVSMSDKISKRLKENGILILSGVLFEQRDSLLRTYRALSFEEIDFYREGEWITVSLKKA